MILWLRLGLGSGSSGFAGCLGFFALGGVGVGGYKAVVGLVVVGVGRTGALGWWHWDGG